MRNRKQLYTLLAMATWMSYSFLSFSYAYRPGFPMATDPTPMGPLVFGAVAQSLPALLFGVILFWWFGKKGERQ